MLSLSHCQRLGIVPVGSAQSEMQAKIISRMKRWGAIIQKGHIKPS